MVTRAAAGRRTGTGPRPICNISRDLSVPKISIAIASAVHRRSAIARFFCHWTVDLPPNIANSNASQELGNHFATPTPTYKAKIRTKLWPQNCRVCLVLKHLGPYCVRIFVNMFALYVGGGATCAFLNSCNCKLPFCQRKIAASSCINKRIGIAKGLLSTWDTQLQTHLAMLYGCFLHDANSEIGLRSVCNTTIFFRVSGSLLFRRWW